MIRSRSECSGIRTLTPVAEGTGNMPQTGGTSEAWNERRKAGQAASTGNSAVRKKQIRPCRSVSINNKKEP